MSFCIVLYIETIIVHDLVYFIIFSGVFFYIKTIIVNDLVSFLTYMQVNICLLQKFYYNYVPASNNYILANIAGISFYYNVISKNFVFIDFCLLKYMSRKAFVKILKIFKN